MRVVAMYRVSTEKQANEGASLDAQERRFQELARASGWKIIAEFRGCESATQAATERHVLQEVMECIRREEPDAIYVHEQSRLTRGDALEVALLLRELTERNVKVIVGGEVRDLSSIDGRFMVGIQSLVDRAEAERIRERSLRGKRERARQGKWNTGMPPYGFRNPPRGVSGHGTLIVEPNEAAVVRRIFEWAAAGASARGIGRRLREKGVPAPRGGRWPDSSVKRILQNPIYVGTHASNVWVPDKKNPRLFRFDPHNEKAILVENAYDPIISKVLWNTVHSRVKPPCTRRPNMLTGLLHVNGLKYSSDRGETGKVYCPPAGNRGRPWLLAGTLDDVVWNAFVGLATKPELIEELKRAARRHHRADQIKIQVKRTEATIQKLQRRLNRLVEMRADGEISRETMAEKSDETRKQMAKETAHLTNLRERLSAASGPTAALIVRAIQTLAGGSSKLTTEQRRSALTSITRRIDVAAIATGARQLRAPGGGYGASGGSRWHAASITFHLATTGQARTGRLATTC